MTSILKQMFCKHRWDKKAHQVRGEFWSDFDKHEPKMWNQKIYETVYICKLCNRVRIERVDDITKILEIQ